MVEWAIDYTEIRGNSLAEWKTLNLYIVEGYGVDTHFVIVGNGRDLRGNYHVRVVLLLLLHSLVTCAGIFPM